MGSIAGELCQWAVVDRGERHRAGVWMHDQRHLATAEWKHLHAGEPGAGWRVKRIWADHPSYRHPGPTWPLYKPEGKGGA